VLLVVLSTRLRFALSSELQIIAGLANDYTYVALHCAALYYVSWRMLLVCFGKRIISPQRPKVLWNGSIL